MEQGVIFGSSRISSGKYVSKCHFVVQDVGASPLRVKRAMLPSVQYFDFTVSTAEQATVVHGVQYDTRNFLVSVH